jgi:hypothetical protein
MKRGQGRKRQPRRSTVTTELALELALAHVRERCLADGSLTNFYLSHRPIAPQEEHQALEKLRANRDRFERSAPAEQRQQIKKLWRFHQAAKYGPLSTSWKRTRRARFFDFFFRLPSFLEPPPGFPPPDLSRIFKTLNAVLKAAQRDDEFWNDFAISKKFRNRRSRVNWFLAEYSWLTLGNQPILTFEELRKILEMKRRTLREKIDELRASYGELAVPLKPGRPGRPRKN